MMQPNHHAAIDEMMELVEAGHAYTITDGDEQPVAIVVPYEHWADIKADLEAINKRAKVEQAEKGQDQ